MRAKRQPVPKLLLLWLSLSPALAAPLSAKEAPDPDLLRAQAALAAGHPSEALEPLAAWSERCACAEAEFLRGRALLELERPARALAAFEEALRRDAGHQPARLHAVLALERLERWEEAARRLEEVSGRGMPTGQPREELAARMADDRRRAAARRAGSAPLMPIRMSDKVNSPFDDFLPVLSVDDHQLWFTSNRPGGLDPLGRGGVFREDIWSSRRGPDGTWGAARLAEMPVNTVGSEGSGALSADGRRFIFSACDRPDGAGDCDLYLTEAGPDGWSPARPLAEVNSAAWDSQPTLSADGDELVFASDRPGGRGGRDLWISRRDAAGRWSEATNAGSILNTAGNEAGPFLHAGGLDLYFSSDGRGGQGELDLFQSRRSPGGAWREPANLGPPFSTADPDLGLCLSADGELALLSSRRAGRPDLDLYASRPPQCCPPEPVRLLVVQVVDDSGRPLDARLRLDPLRAGQAGQWREGRSGHEGLAIFTLPDMEFLAYADAPSHLFACSLSPPRNQAGTAQDTLRLVLAELRPGASTALGGLRFEFDQDRLRPQDEPVLERMREWLAGHPGQMVELRGHTDDVGGTRHNLDLSLRRAEAVRRWLTRHGIPISQIEISGAGAAEPIAQGGSEAARAANRRTELLLR